MQHARQAAIPGWDSSQRLIDIAWPGQGDHPALWPCSVHYRDELNHPFLLDATCLCGTDSIDPGKLLGREVAFGIDLGAERRRWLSGIVTAAVKRGDAGGYAAIDLRVESALSLLDRRRTCRVFQDQSVPEIVGLILDEHRQRNPSIAASFSHASELQHTYPPRSYCLQFNESDRAFIDRLLAEEGITYFFTFDRTNDVCTHQLVLVDASPHPDQVPRTLYYRTHDKGAGQPDEWLSRWESRDQLEAASVSLSSHDYQVAKRQQGLDQNAQGLGEHYRQSTPTLTDYEALAPYYADHDRDLDAYARLRMLAREQRASTFSGEARTADLCIGRSILLEDHPAHRGESTRQRTFILTGTDLRLRNNAPEAWQSPAPLPSPAWHSGGSLAEPNMVDAPGLLLRFQAVRRDVRLVPAYAGAHDRPTAAGLQTATVVGPPGEEVFTDTLGRIRIQFHWQRPEEHPRGTADGNERSSTWVRVAMPSVGDGFGHQFIPRIGQEVLVASLHNDIDRPVVVASLYNGQHAPPAFSGRRGLPGNHALSGIQSREHRGHGYSELVMDDTPGHVRARLASSPSASALNLGKLSTERVDGQAQVRGEGAELRTDAALALRAAHGILITSYARELARGAQLDRQELLALLDECVDLFRGLGSTAARRGASPSDDAGMTRLQQALNAWPDEDAGDGLPVVAIAGEAGVVVTTPHSQLHYAGGNHDVVASDEVQSVSGGMTRLQAGNGLSLYAQDGGIQAIANRGKVLVQAQEADLALDAQRSLHASASQGEILLTAPSIRLVADDGSYLRIGNGIEIGTQGDVKVHGATHDWLGPKSDTAVAPTFGREPAKRQFRFHYEGDIDAVANGISYQLALADGSSVEGISSAAGASELLERDDMQRVLASIRPDLADASGGTPFKAAAGDEPTKEAYDLSFLLKDKTTGEPLKGVRYRIQLDSGDVVVGTTDSEGLTRPIQSPSPQIATLQAPYDDPCTTDAHSHGGSDACGC